MTKEEAIDYNKNLKMYMKISDKNNLCKFLEENYVALDMAIKALEQWSCDDCIRELIREFDKKHPSFDGYMQEFNNHSILEIIEYMCDMRNLIEDIEYRLPN